jgi:uncharacterized protein YabN with tetrapyrrole methylase and pyrophosphatase domain
MRRIRVVGLGVRGIEQLTLAGLRQLREAEAVLHLQRLQLLADQGEFALHVEPGISRLTVMVNDLGIDPLERGTLVVDAGRLLLFEQIPDPAFDTFIHHVCAADTTAHPLPPP